MYLELGDQAIRNYRREDLPQLVARADDRMVWQNLTDLFPHPYTEESGRQWIEHATGQDPQRNFTIVDNRDLVIGGIGVEPKNDIYRVTAEIGYWLGRDWWGQGIATRAVKAFSEWAFTTFAIERLEAGVFETNPASTRVLEKAGYRLEGRLKRRVIKDGRTLDLLMYARVR